MNFIITKFCALQYRLVLKKTKTRNIVTYCNKWRIKHYSFIRILSWDWTKNNKKQQDEEKKVKKNVIRTRQRMILINIRVHCICLQSKSFRRKDIFVYFTIQRKVLKCDSHIMWINAKKKQMFKCNNEMHRRLSKTTEATASMNSKISITRS